MIHFRSVFPTQKPPCLAWRLPLRNRTIHVPRLVRQSLAAAVFSITHLYDITYKVLPTSSSAHSEPLQPPLTP